MTVVVLASRNVHKTNEVRRLLVAAGIEVVALDDAPGGSSMGEIAETGATFEDNALIKARAVAVALGVVAVADDSGLEVDALNGMPGVLSARWSGRHGDDRGNLELVLAQCSDVPDERRGAAFVCATAVVQPDGREYVVRGEMRGRIARIPKGSNGFGYDPIFVADGFDVTNSELSDEAKDAISHRGRALAALMPALRELRA